MDTTDIRGIAGRVKPFTGDSDQFPEFRSKFLMYLHTVDPLLKATIGTDRPVAGGGGGAGGDGDGGAGGGGDPPAPDPGLQWDARSATVYARLALLVSGVAAGVIVAYEDQMNGVAAWRALEQKYLHRGTAGKSFLHQQLVRAKFDPRRDPDEYFQVLERCQTRLRQLDHNISDEMLLGMVLEALPESYGQLISVIDQIDDLTYDMLKTKIRIHYQRHVYKNASKSLAGGPKALWTRDHEKDGEGCYECGGDHFKRNCPLLNGESKKGAPCKKPHWKGSYDSEKGTKWKQGQKRSPFKNFKSQGQDRKKRENPPSDSNKALTVFDADKKPKGYRVDNWLEFVVDSGASTHMVADMTMLDAVILEQGTVTVAGGQILLSIGKGNLHVDCRDKSGKVCGITLQEVLIVPEIGVNLLSVRKANLRGAKVIFRQDCSYIQLGRDQLPITHEQGLCIWKVKLQGVKDPKDTAAYTAVSAKSELWHKRFAHAGLQNFNKIKDKDVEIPEGLKGAEDCGVCELGKQTHISFPKEAERSATEPFENLHADLLGPMEEASVGEARYLAVCTDEFSRYVIVKPIEQKGDFISAFQVIVNEVRGQGFRVKGLRTDHGGEFISKDLKEYCQERKIVQTYSGPYAPQQQGISERKNRTLTEMTRCMLIQSGLPKEMWAEAMNTAAYLVNRLPDENGLSPYFKVFKRYPRINHVRIFGCRAFVQVPKGLRSKLDPKAWAGIFVGYDSSNWRCYRVWDPATRTLRLAVHVSFHENIFPSRIAAGEEPAEPFEDLSELLSDEARTEGVVQPQEQAGVEPVEEMKGQAEEKTAEPDAPPTVQQFKMPLLPRKTNLIDLMQDSDESEEDENQALHANEEVSYTVIEGVMDDPKTLGEALRSPYAKVWKAAMRKEFESLQKTGTWRLVELPRGAHLIGGKWVYRTKRNEWGEIVEFKARWVAKGFSQKPGIDYLDIYAPVARMSSIRTVISLAALNNWDLVNMDVNSAFLNSYVEEEIYVVQPQGFEETGPSGAKLVCRMQKCLYGLKQAPRNWNAVIDTWMVSYGFVISAADPCVYIYRKDSRVLVVLLWVDDLIIAGNNTQCLSNFKKDISSRFQMKDLGELAWILGMEVKRDRAQGTIEITQRTYIELMLTRFKMEDCKAVGTPAEGHLKRVENVGPNKEYMSLVGSLLYAAMVTRPDIAYAVQALGRHMQNSTEEHFSAGKRILRYLQGTKNLGLKYGGPNATAGNGATIEGYVDADWGTDTDTRRSVTAYIFMLGGAAISWGSRLQPTVALSTSEAEYMAASTAVQEAMHIRLLMRSLGYPQEEPMIIFEDNQGCIGISENPIMHKRTKHIDIRYHYVRERVSAGDVKLIYIETERQLADLLTKPLLKPRVERIRGRILGYTN